MSSDDRSPSGDRISSDDRKRRLEDLADHAGSLPLDGARAAKRHA